jgi:hypothetical protein
MGWTKLARAQGSRKELVRRPFAGQGGMARPEKSAAGLVSDAAFADVGLPTLDHSTGPAMFLNRLLWRQGHSGPPTENLRYSRSTSRTSPAIWLCRNSARHRKASRATRTRPRSEMPPTVPFAQKAAIPRRRGEWVKPSGEAAMQPAADTGRRLIVLQLDIRRERTGVALIH